MKRKALLAGVLAVVMLLVCAGCQREIPREEKEVVGGQGLWPYYSFEEAIAEAKTIVYGKTVSRSDVIEEVTSPPEGFVGGEGVTDTVYYCKVSLEPITLVKGEAGEDGKVVVRDFEVETDTHIYDKADVDPIELDQEYVFFLNEYNVFFTPQMMIPVEDGVVHTTNVPDSALDENGKAPESIPVDDYIAMIKEAM